MDRMRPVYVRQKSTVGTPGAPSSPMMSPLHRHARSGSTGVANLKKQKAAAQRLAQVMAHQQADEDDEEDDLFNDYSSVSVGRSIGLAGGRSMRSRSPLPAPSVQEQPPPANSSSGGRSSPSVNYVEQPSSGRSISAGRPSQSSNSVEQPLSARSVTTGRSSLPTNSIEQPPSARSTSAARPLLGVKPVPLVPSSVPISLRPTFSNISPDVPIDNRRDKRMSLDFGSMNLKETSNQYSSALQDELDMLQEENESLLEKAALRVAAQTHGSSSEIIALRTEAENARDEATYALEQLHEAEDELKSLRIMTQRMILTQEEMEEVVLKRCWLARYWSFCVRHGIHEEIAGARYEYWSSFAPLPVDVVLAAGKRAKEEIVNDDLEEKEKVPSDSNGLSGEGNIENILLVEKGLRELASLKVEEAVALEMAQKRRPSSLKSGSTDEVKLPSEGQFEAFELSPEECEDVLFRQAWLTYFWRRAKIHGLEPDIADERLQFWINHQTKSPTSHDAVDVEQGFMELRKLGIETQLWEESRKWLEQESSSKPHSQSDF
nr:coiled-coil domain-containing protein scd2 [Quercus suber]